MLDHLVDTFFNWRVMSEYLPKIVEGFVLTIHLALAVVASGIASGFALAMIRSFRVKPVNFLIIAVVDVLRALPPLVIIIMFYFALPTVGIRMSAYVATWLALSLVLAAFSEEIFWAGILAVPKGQWEAARSTGLTFLQTLRFVVITKGTALGAVVAVGEILYQAQTAYSFSYNPSPLTLGAIAYLILFIPVVYFGRWVETRFAWKR
jgi:His/Glu/Gln/Arg/opine family amino acid ABC transporter permease subunit